MFPFILSACALPLGFDDSGVIFQGLQCQDEENSGILRGSESSFPLPKFLPDVVLSTLNTPDFFRSNNKQTSDDKCSRCRETSQCYIESFRKTRSPLIFLERRNSSFKSDKKSVQKTYPKSRKKRRRKIATNLLPCLAEDEIFSYRKHLHRVQPVLSCEIYLLHLPKLSNIRTVYEMENETGCAEDVLRFKLYGKNLRKIADEFSPFSKGSKSPPSTCFFSYISKWGRSLTICYWVDKIFQKLTSYRWTPHHIHTKQFYSAER